MLKLTSALSLVLLLINSGYSVPIEQDGFKSLQGLKSIYAGEIKLSGGISVDIAARLHQAGIHVLTEEERTPDTPYLGMMLQTNSTNANQLFKANQEMIVQLRLDEPVSLSRDPSRILSAVTWTKSRVIVLNKFGTAEDRYNEMRTSIESRAIAL